MVSDIEIYFNNRKFIITQNIKNAFLSNKPGLIWGNTPFLDIPKLIHFFQTHSEIPNLFAGTTNVNNTFNELLRNFDRIDAAGGVVTNPRNEVLLIKRFGRWDLPKGKVEPNEAIETAAVREVVEETGISNLTIEKPLTVTHHTYMLNGELVIKSTHWFAMRSNWDNALTPQTEEGIEQVKWVKRSDLWVYLSDSYASLMSVLKALD
ncbi:MAG: hypothetical protein PWR03_1307 [Tenuifilum sp.]|jgi:8-oxo-dGTP pyrophosphatase MutT (NUDIX family)|uniref:NUDIX hydrolase n=1 Tax=Tenuifilum sp. TaxID=2760880 RepID=UPI0024AC7ACF|nr:NUDIX domain-containing protein [Tenuifilum sp.]MDI3527124.1 hypothetical protein [Tenuifilum sp.]